MSPSLHWGSGPASVHGAWLEFRNPIGKGPGQIREDCACHACVLVWVCGVMLFYNASTVTFICAQSAGMRKPASCTCTPSLLF